MPTQTPTTSLAKIQQSLVNMSSEFHLLLLKKPSLFFKVTSSLTWVYLHDSWGGTRGKKEPNAGRRGGTSRVAAASNKNT